MHKVYTVSRLSNFRSMVQASMDALFYKVVFTLFGTSQYAQFLFTIYSYGNASIQIR